VPRKTLALSGTIHSDSIEEDQIEDQSKNIEPWEEIERLNALVQVEQKARQEAETEILLIKQREEEA